MWRLNGFEDRQTERGQRTAADWAARSGISLDYEEILRQLFYPRKATEIPINSLFSASPSLSSPLPLFCSGTKERYTHSYSYPSLDSSAKMIVSLPNALGRALLLLFYVTLDWWLSPPEHHWPGPEPKGERTAMERRRAEGSIFMGRCDERDSH